MEEEDGRRRENKVEAVGFWPMNSPEGRREAVETGLSAMVLLLVVDVGQRSEAWVCK